MQPDREKKLFTCFDALDKAALDDTEITDVPFSAATTFLDLIDQWLTIVRSLQGGLLKWNAALQLSPVYDTGEVFAIALGAMRRQVVAELPPDEGTERPEPP